MKRAAILALLLALPACSSDGEQVERGGSDSEPIPVGTLSQIGERLAFELTADPDPLVAGAPVTWTFTVRNVSATPVTVTFADGKKADVALVHENELERYRWSEDRAFTQSIEEWTLAPDQERRITLEEEALDVEPGEYELMAELAGDQAVEPAGKFITVEGAG